MFKKQHRHINPAIIEFLQKSIMIILFSYTYIRICFGILGIDI